jgi:DnaJ-class molecular chaperone
MAAPTGKPFPGAEADDRAVLGVTDTATAAEITTAYRTLVRRLHPDRGHRSTDDQRRLADVIAAYRRLRREAAYDQADPRPGNQAGTDNRRTPTDPGIPVVVRHTQGGPAPIHPGRHAASQPDLRVGPVRRHPTR